MSTKRKHSSCTLHEKLEVLKRLDKGESATKLAAEFGVGKATITDWKKNRVKIEQFCATTSGKTLEKRHNSTTSVYDKLDEATFLWFTQERQKGVPISGTLIQEKALQLNKMLNGDSTFTASNGWLHRWKNRHGVRQLSITGEKLSADVAAANDYLDEFSDMVFSENYSAQQVYNADESGLNFKALPKKSLASQEEKCAPGFKMNKERLTILACCNAAATNKLPLMVIGKSAKPRALKNINMNSLPVFYRNQRRAWMNGDLFEEWFKKQFVPSVTKFNEENGLPNKALLLIDNATSHPPDSVLVKGDIKAIFLPPNVTPILQPMDQGVLQNIKLYYRKMLLRMLIEGEEDSSIKDRLKKVTIRDVIYWVAEAWEKCNKTLIQKSWKKLWPTLQFEETNFEVQPQIEDLLPLVQQIPGCEEAEQNCLQEWIADDDDGNQDLSEGDIVSMVQDPVENNAEESEEEDTNDLTDVVSHADAASALEVALRYVEQHAAATPTDVMFMRRWRNIASSSRFTALRQKKITDFVQTN